MPRFSICIPNYNYAQYLGDLQLQRARAVCPRLSAYVPMTLHTHGISNVIVQPWVMGYTISAFGSSWKYLYLDNSKRR